MRNKRGMDDVVTTLLIILLTVVAISVIWIVVRDIIQKGSKDIELGKFTLDLGIESVSIGEDNVTVVVVRRNPCLPRRSGTKAGVSHLGIRIK